MKRLFSIFLLFIFSGTIAFSAQPNFLLIIADDCTYRDLGVYGGQAKTPHLDKLAGEGMKFNRCFQAAPMCSPTRHNLYTGLYPVKSGAYPNHTMAYDWVKSIAHYLQATNYTTQLAGKSHVSPKSVFPFAKGITGDSLSASLGNTLKSSAASGKPFLFIFASHEPHDPWDKGDASKYPPATLKLPPVLVDAPDTREAFSRYLAEITYFDGEVGQLLQTLDQSPQRDNTFVIVLSEQGNSFPFAKWTCYDAGLQSGCIVRWPGKIKPSSVSDALIEYVDVVPTFLEMAGVKRPEILDGRSFLPVLTGEATTHKTHVYGLQTTRGIVGGSDHFGIRSVREARYRYIRNLTPEATFQNLTTKDRTFKTWVKMAAAGDTNAQQLVHDYQHRPAEELYDCEADPWNRRNLVNDPKLVGKLAELRAKLDAWMKQQGDTGQDTEMKAHERMPRKSRGEEEPKQRKK